MNEEYLAIRMYAAMMMEAVGMPERHATKQASAWTAGARKPDECGKLAVAHMPHCRELAGKMVKHYEETPCPVGRLSWRLT